MTKECPVCKSMFHVKPSHFTTRIYCTRKCMAYAYRKRLSGPENPNYKGRDKEFLECVICGKNFQPADLSRKSAKVCGNKCRSKIISNSLKGKPKSIEQVRKALETKRSKWVPSPDLICICGKSKTRKSIRCRGCVSKNILGICIYCNKTFKKKVKTRKYCNIKCLARHKEVIYKGENNPHWKNGLTPTNQRQRRHVAYKQWRTSVFERDNYTCTECRQVGGNLHAHHIKSYSKFPDLRLDIANGKTLCLSCHEKEHPGKHFKRLSKPLNKMTF
jgi:hypothetical protein